MERGSNSHAGWEMPEECRFGPLLTEHIQKPLLADAEPSVGVTKGNVQRTEQAVDAPLSTYKRTSAKRLIPQHRSQLSQHSIMTYDSDGRSDRRSK